MQLLFLLLSNRSSSHWASLLYPSNKQKSCFHSSSPDMKLLSWWLSPLCYPNFSQKPLLSFSCATELNKDKRSQIKIIDLMLSFLSFLLLRSVVVYFIRTYAAAATLWTTQLCDSSQAWVISSHLCHTLHWGISDLENYPIHTIKSRERSTLCNYSLRARCCSSLHLIKFS